MLANKKWTAMKMDAVKKYLSGTCVLKTCKLSILVMFQLNLSKNSKRLIVLYLKNIKNTNISYNGNISLKIKKKGKNTTNWNQNNQARLQYRYVLI